jgi:hypothetical protein
MLRWVYLRINKLKFYNSILELPNLSMTKFGSWISLDNRFMLVPKNSDIKVREIPQKKGGIKYAIDPMHNPINIELSTGGIYILIENVLVAGRIGITSDCTFSNDIFNSLSKKIKKEFEKIGTFYVGKDAEEKLHQGWRLVTNHKSPKEYDLSIKY